MQSSLGESLYPTTVSCRYPSCHFLFLFSFCTAASLSFESSHVPTWNEKNFRPKTMVWPGLYLQVVLYCICDAKDEISSTATMTSHLFFILLVTYVCVLWCYVWSNRFLITFYLKMSSILNPGNRLFFEPAIHGIAVEYFPMICLPPMVIFR